MDLQRSCGVDLSLNIYLRNAAGSKTWVICTFPLIMFTKAFSANNESCCWQQTFLISSHPLLKLFHQNTVLTVQCMPVNILFHEIVLIIQPYQPKITLYIYILVWFGFRESHIKARTFQTQRCPKAWQRYGHCGVIDTVDHVDQDPSYSYMALPDSN